MHMSVSSELRFRRECAESAEYKNLGTEGKRQFRLRWAESKWAQAQSTKEEDESKEEELSSKKSWKTLPQLRKLYGSRKAAKRHADRCRSMGNLWAKYSSFAGVWMFKYIEVEEKAKSKKRWSIRKRYAQDPSVAASAAC